MHSLFSQPFSPNQAPDLDVLEAHAISWAFYDEVRQRQRFEAYCEWYYQVAEQHRQELKSMQSDINILGWFCRR